MRRDLRWPATPVAGEGRTRRKVRAGHPYPGQAAWVNLVAPTRVELEALAAEFHLSDFAMEALARPARRPGFAMYDEVALLVAYAATPRDRATVAPANRPVVVAGPSARRARSADHGMPWLVTGRFRADQVQVLLRDDLMVTVSQMPVANVEASWTRWATRMADAPAHVGDPAYLLLDSIVDEYVPILDRLVEDIGDVERRILEENVASARALDLRDLFKCKRDLAQFGRVVGPQRASIAALGRLIGDLVHEDSPAYFQDVSDHLARLGTNVESYHDMLESSLNAHLVLVGNGQNEVMKTLTVVTIVMGIPGIITAWYGSNIKLPEMAWPFAYPIALAAMVMIVMGAVAFLRRRGLA